MEEATANTTVTTGIDSISTCSKDSINAMDIASAEINGSTGLVERGSEGSAVFRVRAAFRKNMEIHL
jgi:hypothetical protein